MRCLLAVKTRMRHGRHASHGHETQIEGSEEDSGFGKIPQKHVRHKHTHTYHLLSVIIRKSSHMFSSFEDIAFVWKVTIRAIMVVMMIMLAVTAMDMDSMDTTMVTAIASGV